MVMDTGITQTATLQTFALTPLLGKLLMQLDVQILKSMTTVMVYQIQVMHVHRHLLVNLSTQMVVQILNSMGTWMESRMHMMHAHQHPLG